MGLNVFLLVVICSILNAVGVFLIQMSMNFHNPIATFVAVVIGSCALMGTGALIATN